MRETHRLQQVGFRKGGERQDTAGQVGNSLILSWAKPSSNNTLSDSGCAILTLGLQTHEKCTVRSHL